MSLFNNLFQKSKIMNEIGIIYIHDLEKVGGHFYEEKIVKKGFLKVEKAGILELDGIKIHGRIEKSLFEPALIIDVEDYEEDGIKEKSGYLVVNQWVKRLLYKMERDNSDVQKTIMLRENYTVVARIMDIAICLMALSFTNQQLPHTASYLAVERVLYLLALGGMVLARVIEQRVKFL